MGCLHSPQQGTANDKLHVVRNMRATAEVSLQLCTLLEAQIGQWRVQDVGLLERRLVVMEPGRQGTATWKHPMIWYRS